MTMTAGAAASPGSFPVLGFFAALGAAAGSVSGASALPSFETWGRPLLRGLGADPDAPDVVHLTITDRGIGIPHAERELVFERFYRVRQAIERGFKGTGIGLYIARSLVELHGGSIWASDALHGERGTTLHLRLPCVVEDEDGPEDG